MATVADDLRLDIDKLRLDEEWVDQPKLFFKWARKHADALLRVDKTKSYLDLVKADLDAAIRKDPASFGQAKITEKVVENLILGNDEYQVAVKTVAEARHDVAILAAAVEALQHRKRGLECLVTLHGQQYFAGPRAHGDNREAMEDVEKKAVRRKGQAR